jgi:hypothetical protein
MARHAVAVRKKQRLDADAMVEPSISAGPLGATRSDEYATANPNQDTVTDKRTQHAPTHT